MRRKLLGAALAAMVTTTAVLALESEASACGGCFSPPTENPTVVTDHRMILSVSKEQTTLYDQIRYQGEPSAFAWVLPISGAGDVKVGLSADVVFSALDANTQTRLISPPQNCPPAPNCNSRFGSAASAGESAPQDGGGVTVVKKEVVGPYETVQLKATDPTALKNWLQTNNFAVPADVQPVIDQYVAEKFDFLALKLIPGKGVRVTTKGAASVLPLRMVAAGTGPVVGIGLWIIGEGRYEPQNFPSFYIPTDEIVWDWTQSKSNYTDLRAAKTTAGGGRAWETESSTLLNRGNFESQVQYGFFGGGGGGAPIPSDPEAQAQQAYLPVKDDQGNITKTAQQVRAEDMDTLFFGIPSVAIRATRLRADLQHAALDQDLVVTASKDQAVLSNVRQITREANEPLCPVFNGCDNIGQAPRSEAQARADGDSGESFSCSTTSKPTSPTWLGLGAGFLALAMVKASRRRRG
jgi:hypothetical protein